MSNEQQDAQSNVKRVAQTDPQPVKPNTLAKRRQRAREKAQTEVGKKMALSEAVVKPDVADDILRLERGLRDVHGSTSAHIRKVIYRLAEDAAEALGLPGPNYHLLRWGFAETKNAMSDPDYVPSEKYPFENPDASPDGELCTNLELFCMMDMLMQFQLPTKAQAALLGEVAVETLVRDGEIAPERLTLLKEAGRALQKLAEQGIEPDEAFVHAAIEFDLHNLTAEQRAELDALPEDEKVVRVSVMPYTARALKQFDFSLE